MTINLLQLPTYPAAAGIARVAGNVIARVVDVFRAYKHRRALTQLSHLDERMLRDIGLTRGDLRDAAAEPLWRDPTTVLVRRSNERRSTRNRISVIPGGVTPSPALSPASDEGHQLFPARSRYY